MTATLRRHSMAILWWMVSLACVSWAARSTGGQATVQPPAFPPVEQLPDQNGLPDPFVRLDGRRVESRADWNQQREYLKAMLAHYQYGHMPPRPTRVRVERGTSASVFEGKAIATPMTLVLSRRGKEVALRAAIVRPARAGTFPVIIKNSTDLFDLEAPADEQEDGRIGVETAAFQDAVSRGYVICKFLRTDLAADRAGNRNTGVLALYPEYDWGTIAAWALIAPRALLNTHALQDYWANPYGTQVTYQAAQIVFRWLGAADRQGLHWRPGGHAQNREDWNALLDFADAYFFAKPTARRFDASPYGQVPPPRDWIAPRPSR